MEIDGVLYAEKNDSSLPPVAEIAFGLCVHCALFKTNGCGIAISGAAEMAFGGDCARNDVVYVRVKNETDSKR